MLLLSLVLPGLACAEPPIADITWGLRLRHERVDDDAFARNARADTLRLRAAIRFAFGGGWSALVEGEALISGDDEYNSGANGQAHYPAVIDPEGSELNQAWMGWRNARFGFTAGRQRITLDNRRWVGNVGWRQNEQTFDALALQWQPTPALTVKYDWLGRVHRVFGDRALAAHSRERELDTHLLNAGWRNGKQQWTGYAYLHDDRDLAGDSSATFGLRWIGVRAADDGGWGWTLELARQHDFAGNPSDFSHGYWLVEPSYTWRGATFKAGWEHMGGDGHHALQTPLATLHAFDGWADKFVVTPAGGLEDRYLSASGRFGHVRGGHFAWTVAFHDFRADTPIAGIEKYGREWDASLGFPLGTRLQALIKLADYRSDGFARDTTKLWLQLEWTGANMSAVSDAMP